MPSTNLNHFPAIERFLSTAKLQSKTLREDTDDRLIIQAHGKKVTKEHLATLRNLLIEHLGESMAKRVTIINAPIVEEH